MFRFAAICIKYKTNNHLSPQDLYKKTENTENNSYSTGVLKRLTVLINGDRYILSFLLLDT